MIVDSHCHLNMLDENDIASVVGNAKAQGVETILCVGVDLINSQEVIQIAEQFDNVWASVGVHPSTTLENEASEQEYLELADHPKVVAIGETGLDYYYNEEGLENMRERFRTQIRVAKKIRKPLIIHSRGAREDTINIMREENASDIGGVMHCFTESLEMAKQAMSLGFYISFSGIVTFKNAKNVSEVATQVPIKNMLIETDAPYLAPVPYRGKKNLPEYVRFVVQQVAELKQLSYEEVAKHTTNNFYELFKGAQQQ